MNEEDIMKEYQQMMDAFDSIGVAIIGADTAARIMAVLLECGNDERMVLSPKFQIECKYIQKRYHIGGAEVPDREFAKYLKIYVKELQEKGEITDWGIKLYKERYGIDMSNHKNQ